MIWLGAVQVGQPDPAMLLPIRLGGFYQSEALLLDPEDSASAHYWLLRFTEARNTRCVYLHGHVRDGFAARVDDRTLSFSYQAEPD